MFSLSHWQTALAVIASPLLLYFIYGYIYWWIQARRMKKSPGYIPPSQSLLTKIVTHHLARFFSWCFVGPMTVIGRENAHYRGRLMIAPNHAFGLDFLVMQAALDISYRQVGTKSQVLSPGRALMSAWNGLIAIDTEWGKAKSKQSAERIIEAYARVLNSERRDRKHGYPSGRLQVFFQGTLEYGGDTQTVLDPSSNKLERGYRTGGIRGMQLAREREAGPMAVLPVAIIYHTQHKNTDVVGMFGKSRKGVTVVIGKPIEFDSLPSDCREATEVVRKVVQAQIDMIKSGLTKIKT